MWWHENIPNMPVGLGGWPPISTWKLCKDSESLESVEPIITNNYKRTCWNKKCQEEQVGIGGWPPISTWINHTPLGRNGIHCIEFPHQMSKFMLNLAPIELLALVQEFPFFDKSIKMKLLLMSSLEICVHDLISGCMFHVFRVELCWCQLFCYLWCVQ